MFPSPLGASYFQICIRNLTKSIWNIFSVPSRGILFPNSETLWVEKPNLFPSPLGASYFQINKATDWTPAPEEFPSPLGASYFQIVKCWFLHKKVISVSVPSRGILFPNNGKTVEPNDGMIGFRPLSGHLISKSTIRTVKTLNEGDMFPSPLGASYFQINMARKRMVTRTMFPSPLGASYFQIKGDFIMEENRNEFPSPLGASYFQIRCSRPVRVSKTSFPSPLGASYFQIRRNDVYRKNYRWSVSVPSRGILFPNLYEDYNEYIRVYEFPSPLGASYFQIRSLFSFINDEYGFRPLSGHLISK